MDNLLLFVHYVDFQSCLKNPHLVADWPVMLNDVVIAVVVFVVVPQVAVVMLGMAVVVAVMDDMLVRVHLAVGFGQEVGEIVDPGGGPGNVLRLLLLLVVVGVVREVHDRLPVLRREHHRLRMLLLSTQYFIP